MWSEEIAAWKHRFDWLWAVIQEKSMDNGGLRGFYRIDGRPDGHQKRGMGMGRLDSFRKSIFADVSKIIKPFTVTKPFSVTKAIL